MYCTSAHIHTNQCQKCEFSLWNVQKMFMLSGEILICSCSSARVLIYGGSPRFETMIKRLPADRNSFLAPRHLAGTLCLIYPWRYTASDGNTQKDGTINWLRRLTSASFSWAYWRKATPLSLSPIPKSPTPRTVRLPLAASRQARSPSPEISGPHAGCCWV